MAAVAIPLRNPVPNVIDRHLDPHGFPREISGLVNEFVMRRPECFGGAEWRKYFGVDVGNPHLPDEFVVWWSDFDAFDLDEKRPNPRRNYETHIDPIWRPEFINGDQPYHLEALSGLAEHPLNGGHPTRFTQDTEAYRQHARTPAGRGYWLVPRKGVIARGRTSDQQKEELAHVNRQTGARYEPDTALLDLATYVAVRHVWRRESHLGDSTGMDGLRICARSRNLVRYGDKRYFSILGGSVPSGVRVDNYYDCDRESLGVVALQKFEPARSPEPS